MSGAREQALASAHLRCPRCGAQREPDQEFCVECALRLPVVTGTLPALRRRWLRRLGWYPGDWIWLSIPTFLVAAAGAAISIAVTSHGRAGGAGATLVAPAPRLAKPSVAPAPARRGGFAWPAGVSGWTVVLLSTPATHGTRKPHAIAVRAARAGLPEVGVLDSSAFTSLHPGYYVVFSGVYSTPADAGTALLTAHARGFGGAYPRQISP